MWYIFTPVNNWKIHIFKLHCQLLHIQENKFIQFLYCCSISIHHTFRKYAQKQHPFCSILEVRSHGINHHPELHIIKLEKVGLSTDLLIQCLYFRKQISEIDFLLAEAWKWHPWAIDTSIWKKFKIGISYQSLNKKQVLFSLNLG